MYTPLETFDKLFVAPMRLSNTNLKLHCDYEKDIKHHIKRVGEINENPPAICLKYHKHLQIILTQK